MSDTQSNPATLSSLVGLQSSRLYERPVKENQFGHDNTFPLEGRVRVDLTYIKSLKVSDLEA